MKELDKAKEAYFGKVVRHVITNDHYFVKDVIVGESGISLVMQALRDQAIDARHRLFTALLEYAEKHYEIENKIPDINNPDS